MNDQSTPDSPDVGGQGRDLARIDSTSRSVVRVGITPALVLLSLELSHGTKQKL
jgi:hypothetical protein